MYNAEKTVVNALDSVKIQTYDLEEFDVIVINDGSTDQSKVLVESYIKANPEMNIKLINQINGGVSKARNTGLKIAKGEYIALLDADDEWLPNKIETQMSYFKNRSMDIDFLATARNNNKILYPYKSNNNLAKITFNRLLIRNEAQPSTVIFKSKIIENTGYFDDNQRYAEDVNYWMKVSLKNKMYILDQSLVIVGKGERSFGVSGLSANLSEMRKGFSKNLYEMYKIKKISFIQYLGLRLFYRAKYLLLLGRQFYYNSNTKNKDFTNS